MAVICSGEITPTLGGKTVTFTDTGTGYSTIIDRSLTVNDADGNTIATYVMALNLTQVVPVAFDQRLQFILRVTDINGAYSCEVNYLAEGYFAAASLNRLAASGCSCTCQNFWNQLKGEFNLSGSEYAALFGLAETANTLISRANIFINSTSN